MDEYEDVNVGPLFLPGVDLALWFRLVLALAVAVVAVVVAAMVLA